LSIYKGLQAYLEYKCPWNSNQAESKTGKLPATETVAERASSLIEPCKRRYIEDTQAPETVPIEGLAESKTQRQEPKTGKAETQYLQKGQKGKDKVLLYIRHN
jgi:hypothetical protein